MKNGEWYGQKREKKRKRKKQKERSRNIKEVKRTLKKKCVALINKLADASKEKKDGGEAGERVKGGERGLVERIG